MYLLFGKIAKSQKQEWRQVMYVAVLLTWITAPHMRFSVHYLTRAPTQPDAIRGTAGMSSVYLFFGKIAITESQECWNVFDITPQNNVQIDDCRRVAAAAAARSAIPQKGSPDAWEPWGAIQ